MSSMLSHPRVLATAVALCLLTIPLTRPHAAEPPKPVEFNRDVRPILSDKCFACHGPDPSTREADLRFDIEEEATADLGGYRAIDRAKPESSELLARIIADEDSRMPPVDSGKELSAAEIDVLKQWIAQGARYEAHWSFTPPQRPTLPPVRNGDWPVNDVDRFILARLEAECLTPSPDADPATLVRRLAFDLVGLPPTAEQLDEFLREPAAEAYERLVDRLLESPHFGERMAVYWLDLVRYADTVGYHGDQEHAITPYRDWVIHAFNNNMPFDQFTIEQLAGDLLPGATTDQKIASGYNRLLQTSHEGGVQVKEYLSKYDADRVRNVSAVWMGATMGCAQCHSHKYDPYTLEDFYRMAAFFADVDDLRTFRGGDTTPTKREPELVVLSPLDREQIERWEAQAIQLEQQLDAARTATGGAASDAVDESAATDSAEERIADLTARRDELRALIDARRQQTRRTMVTESVKPRTIRVLPRGDWMDDSGEIVEPAVPQFLPPLGTEQRATRLDLARWLTAPDHPQTSRVFVNRLWYLLFGTGLSKTLDDTGSQGEWPTHPELLDYLAVEFVESGWDVKRMVKRLVMSRTYRQTSVETAELRQGDPENRLFARQARFRLPSEMIRDNALAVSGLLVDRIGGPSARPYQPARYYQALNFPKREYQADKDDNQYRRGVYVHWQRQFLHPMLRAFDAPTREECTAQRPVSNTPLAALTLLNDPTFVEAARVFATRILLAGGPAVEDRIAWAWRQALAREPDAREVESLVEFAEFSRQLYAGDEKSARALINTGLSPPPAELDPVELAAWTQVARALLNLNETITRN